MLWPLGNSVCVEQLQDTTLSYPEGQRISFIFGLLSSGDTEGSSDGNTAALCSGWAERTQHLPPCKRRTAALHSQQRGQGESSPARGGLQPEQGDFQNPGPWPLVLPTNVSTRRHLALRPRLSSPNDHTLSFLFACLPGSIGANNTLPLRLSCAHSAAAHNGKTTLACSSSIQTYFPPMRQKQFLKTRYLHTQLR